MRAGGVGLVVASVLAGAGLVGGFLALGGADRLQETARVAAAPTAAECDAAATDAIGAADGEAVASQLLLVALQDAACELAVPRAELVLALGRAGSIADAAADVGVAPAALESAVLGSIEAAVAAAEADGAVTPTTALAVRTLLDVVPPDQLLASVQGADDTCGELPWKPVDTLDEVAAQIGVKTGLRTACALSIAPLEAVAALADPAGISGLVNRSGRPEPEVEEVVREAIGASIEEAAAADALSGTEATVLGAAARVAPVDRLLAIVRGDDDPCTPFPWPGSGSRTEALAAIVLIGSVDAACQLGATTFDVFAALASPAELAELEQVTGRSQVEIEAALRAGIDRGIDEAQGADAISGLEVLLLRAVLSQVGILDLLGSFTG